MNQSFFKRPLFWYGIYFGVASIVYFILIYAINFEFFGRFLLFITIGFAIQVTFMILGGIAERKAAGGYLKYGKAMLSCLLIGLIGSLVSLIFSFIFVNYIDPEFLKNLSEVMKESVMNFMQSFGSINDEDIDKALANMDKEFANAGTIVYYLKQFFLRELPWSLFFALICAIFVKKNPPAEFVPTATPAPEN